MRVLPFRSPTAPLRVPLWTRLKAEAQIAIERALPPGLLLRISARALRAKLALSPKLRRRLKDMLCSLAPPGAAPSPRELRRQMALCRAVRLHCARSFAIVARRPSEWLMRELHPEGLEHLEAVKRSGSGAILLHSHAGNTAWEAPVLRALGYPLKSVQSTIVVPAVYLLLRRLGLLGEALPYPSPGEEGLHLKWLLDLLRRGTWLQHIGDTPDPETGVPGVFFGHQVRYTRAPWVLGRLSGAPIIPTLILTDAQCRFHLTIGQPLRVGAKDKGFEAPFQSYLDFLAHHLATAPWNLRRKQWESTPYKLVGLGKRGPERDH